MKIMLDIELPKAEKLIDHRQKILFIGSCFTEHIAGTLENLKFDILQNPNGILFDPASITYSLKSYINAATYKESDLFQQEEIWHSWHHHSRFSGTDKDAVIKKINDSQHRAHLFLKIADWLIITLGTAFSYRLIQENMAAVANCHRAPAQWFQKHLMPIEETESLFEATIHHLLDFNPNLNIIFTISPVRHIRDGIIENNRSKARLIESVHNLINKFDNIFYFPSYELVIDVLRDYRFYSEDMVHPNYLATDFVLHNFVKTFMSNDTIELINDIKKLNIALKHRSAHPSTQAHKKFLLSHLNQVQFLQQKFPFLNFDREIDHFTYDDTLEGKL